MFNAWAILPGGFFLLGIVRLTIDDGLSFWGTGQFAMLLAVWAFFSSTLIHSLFVKILVTDSGITFRRLRPIVIPREDVYRVGRAPVRWGRGDPVEGIEIQTPDGKRVELPYSEFLGVDRANRWVADIEEHFNIDSTARPLIAPARKMTRPVSFKSIQRWNDTPWSYFEPWWID